MSKNVPSRANRQDSRLNVEHPHCGTREVRADVLSASVSTSVKLYKTYSIQSLQASKELIHSFPRMPSLCYSCSLYEAEIALKTYEEVWSSSPDISFSFSQEKLLTDPSPNLPPSFGHSSFVKPYIQAGCPKSTSRNFPKKVQHLQFVVVTLTTSLASFILNLIFGSLFDQYCFCLPFDLELSQG